MLGSAPGTPGEEVLNRIIAKFSQPEVISPAQMAKMAHEIAFLKDTLPKQVFIVRSQTYADTGADFRIWTPLKEMFIRNGIEPQVYLYKPGSINEVGMLLIVKDPSTPPTYVTKFISALELAGITNVKTSYIPGLYHEDALTIFIAPPPI